MTEILSQDEIDQLLTAISFGELENEEAEHDFKKRNIRIWDFRRPDKFSKEHIRTVSFLHETFARLTSTSLATHLRSMVQVSVVSVDQLTYEEFLRSIPSPTTIAVINMDPLDGSAIMEIDPSITFTIIDRLFGGSGERVKIQRELSEIERVVMESIILRILGNMREAWSQVVDLRPRLGQIDTNPQFVQIVPPTEMVLLVTLETKIEDVEGIMNFCIPYLTIESIISKLSAQYWYSSVRRDSTPKNLNIIRGRLASVDVSLIAEVGRINLPVKDVISLQEGSVIHLSGTRVGDSMIMKLGNRSKFECRPGVSGKHIAVQITRKIEDLEESDFEELVSEGDDE